MSSNMDVFLICLIDGLKIKATRTAPLKNVFCTCLPEAGTGRRRQAFCGFTVKKKFEVILFIP